MIVTGNSKNTSLLPHTHTQTRESGGDATAQGLVTVGHGERRRTDEADE